MSHVYRKHRNEVTSTDSSQSLLHDSTSRDLDSLDSCFDTSSDIQGQGGTTTIQHAVHQLLEIDHDLQKKRKCHVYTTP